MTDDREPAGRESSGAERMFGDFAPGLVHFTDDVLFGEVWERPQLSRKERSLITVEAITHLAFSARWPRAYSAIAVAKCVFEN